MSESNLHSSVEKKPYQQALEWMYGLRPRGIQLGLERMERALSELGHPEISVPWVHVAGTNGKGSTASMIESGLRASGYKTALFTSPHIHRFVERIKVGGEPIAEEIFLKYAKVVRDYLDKPNSPQLTFFEVATCIAFLVFQQSQCDIGVLEVGLGGRLDSTNVIRSKLSVITPISMDHENRLGDTLEKIAFEKAGIIQVRTPLIISKQNPKALQTILKEAEKKQAEVLMFEKDYWVEAALESKYEFCNLDGARMNLEVSLAGQYQIENAACAVAALLKLRALGMKVSDDSIQQGLLRVKWPCRLEQIAESPTVIVDAAHNPSAAEYLADFVAEKHKDQKSQSPVILVFGSMKDKNWQAMLCSLVPCVDQIIFTKVDMERALEPEFFVKQCGGEVVSDPILALNEARKNAGDAGTVIVAGSIFLASQIRAHVLEIEADPLIAM